MRFLSKINYNVRVIALFLLCMCDLTSTYILLGRGAIEMNPFVNILLDIGMTWFVVGKILISLLGCASIWFWSKINIANVLLNVSLVVYALVVLWNTFLVIISS